MELVILHLSDLHFDNKNIKDINIVLDALWKDIKKLDLKVDYILFNGDLVNRGNEMEQFNLAKTGFINPLLESTSLSINEFFMVPGNHEVNRDSINQFIDGNITDKFNNRDDLNYFIDTIDKNKQLLVRLDNYNKFNGELHKENSNLNTSNPMYSTYIFNHGDTRIGLACLNTAWGSFGGDDDYAKILLGERQVDNSINDLEDCDYKIAMLHHPIEWYKEFDRESVYDRLITGFNMVMTGHVHSQNYKEIAFDNYNTVFLKSASLFQGRTYNGYSILKFNFESNELEVILREYYDGARRVFGKAERIAEDGLLKLSLNKKKNDKTLKKNLTIKKTLKEKVFIDINNKLLSVSSDSMAPKEINDIFVPPFLTTQPEESGNAKKELMDDENLELTDVLNSDKNILLIGKKEMGKTTLINYICNFYLNKHENIRIPVIIDFNELPKGKNVVHKAIQNFLINYDIVDFDISENLKKGNCVLLVDNFNLKNSKNLERFVEFCQEFGGNRFIVAMNEDILQTMKIKDLPNLGFNYSKYYINTFRRGQIRQLVKNWFSFKDINDDLILDRVIASIKSIGVPRTPMFISLMLWILEKQSNFVPVNEASLVENFIETLLEKLHIEEAKYETVGYKIKKDFLAYIARKMVDNNECYIERSRFEEYYVHYFNSKGLEISSELKETFFQKGILLNNGNKIYFRFTCFLEYFIAVEMAEDESLYDKILSKTNYLDYINEITYFTGLNQKRKSYEILKIIEERLLESFQEIDEIIDIREISRLPVKEVIFSAIEEGNIKTNLKEVKLSDEEKDILLDAKDEKPAELSHIKDNRKEEVKEEFIKNLELYSSVLKNCELIEVEMKNEALSLAIEKYCKLVGVIYKLLYQFLYDDLENENSMVDAEMKEDDEQIYMLTVGVPLIIQSFTLKNLGTPKLKISIEREILKASTDFEKLMLVSLYGDLRLEGYIGQYELLLKSTKSKLIKEIIFMKLFYYQAFYTMNKFEKSQLVNLLSDVIIEKQQIKTKNVKGQIKQTIMKQRLLNQRKIIE
ncbi:metallophosphoesterase [Bacillus thuringiensis]|uniref:metallophosphoesterase n=1 Tax=Bacillus thuringiensis TaxID=1428 RepID=UPI00077E2AE4|nr:metallophosphoesterase [Bacillus thuringiensis]AMR05739.1 hypothetical protein AXW78_26900 [Bacillus thuringiensis]PNK35962.1 hypothetical protein CBR55_22880 [Bacillus thuringiensis]